MAWRQIYVSDVTQWLTPAENAVLQSVQNSNARLATMLSDTASEFIGAISGAQGPDAVITDGSVPDQLRSHISALAVWRWLRSFPQYKTIKTQEREDAAKDAERIYEKIVNRTYGAIESPYKSSSWAGSWNSENKLIMRTHPIPTPTQQFSQRGFSGGRPFDASLALVFAAAAGTIPPFTPATVGQWAINETTNETWFVNQSLAWQQEVGV